MTVPRLTYSTEHRIEVALIEESDHSAAVLWGSLDDARAAKRVNWTQAAKAGLPTFVKNLNAYANGYGRLVRADIETAAAQVTELLTEGDINELFAQVPPNGPGLSIELTTTSTRWLELPWELVLFTGRPPTLDRRKSFVRVVPVRTRSYGIPPSHDKVLTLLVVADPQHRTPVGADRHVEVLRKNLETAELARKSQLYVLPNATRRALVDDLKATSYDILVFVGHGFNGALTVERRDGSEDVLTPADIRTTFCDGRLKLVVLLACGNSAEGDPMNVHHVASELVLRGIPAVVVVPYRLPINTSIAFLRDFTSALLKQGLAIDEAMTFARLGLFHELDGQGPDWAMPVLYRAKCASTLTIGVGGR